MSDIVFLSSGVGRLSLILDDDVKHDRLTSFNLHQQQQQQHQLQQQGGELILADFGGGQFKTPSPSISIELTFTNPYKTYWAQFVNDNSEINICNNGSIVFCGFSWSEREGGRVKEIRLNNHDCCGDRVSRKFKNNVFFINVYETIDRRQQHHQHQRSRVQTDCVDGGGGHCASQNLSLFETGERGREVYERNTKFEKGRLVQRLYLVFYNAVDVASVCSGGFV
jgi:hypothetical protein